MSVKFVQIKTDKNGTKHTVTRMLNRKAFTILMQSLNESAKARKAVKEDLKG